MPSRRQFLATLGVGTAAATAGWAAIQYPNYTIGPDEDEIPGPDYPNGTLVVYNTSRMALSVTVTTVDHTPSATLETVLPSGESAIRRGFVSAPPGTTVTLQARVERFAEAGTSFSFVPGGGGPGSDRPPQYARLNILGSEDEVNWQTREALP